METILQTPQSPSSNPANEANVHSKIYNMDKLARTGNASKLVTQDQILS